MIEVNLLPGGKKRPSRGPSLSLSLPSFGGLSQDRWVLAAVVLLVAALGAAGYLWLTVTSETEEVQVALDQAVQDSARFADLIARTEALTARRDSIAQRVAIIQEIDQGRYTWPHILDEVARALPDYTWLTSVLQTRPGLEPSFAVEGMAGNLDAVTVFMDQLESSPFIRAVELITSEQQVAGEGTGDQQIVLYFRLEASYEQPPVDILETVPLFETDVPEVPPDTAASGTGG